MAVPQQQLTSVTSTPAASSAGNSNHVATIDLDSMELTPFVSNVGRLRPASPPPPPPGMDDTIARISTSGLNFSYDEFNIPDAELNGSMRPLARSISGDEDAIGLSSHNEFTKSGSPGSPHSVASNSSAEKDADPANNNSRRGSRRGRTHALLEEDEEHPLSRRPSDSDLRPASRQSNSSVYQLDLEASRGLVAAYREEIAALETQLTSLRGQVRDMEDKGRGISDANARVAREVKLRQAVDAARKELEVKLEESLAELRDLELRRMQAEKASSENADIAHAWKERCETYETAFRSLQGETARLRTESETANQKLQELQAQFTLQQGRQSDSDKVSSELQALLSQQQEMEMSLHAARVAEADLRLALETSQKKLTKVTTELQDALSQNESLQSRSTLYESQLLDVSNLLLEYIRTDEETLTKLLPFARDPLVPGPFKLKLGLPTGKPVHIGDMLHSLLSADHKHFLSSVRTISTAVQSSCSHSDATIHELQTQLEHADARNAARADDTRTVMLERQVVELQKQLDAATAQLQRDVNHVVAAKQAELDVMVASIRAEGAQQMRMLERAWDSQRADMEDQINKLKTQLQATEASLAEVRKGYETTLENRSKLVREWEEYANHWESRGREAERLNLEWETAFDKLQAEYTKAVSKTAAAARPDVSGAGSTGAVPDSRGKPGDKPVAMAAETPRKAAAGDSNGLSRSASASSTSFEFDQLRPDKPAPAAVRGTPTAPRVNRNSYATPTYATTSRK